MLPFSIDAKDICVSGYDVRKVDGELNQLSCFDPRMLKVFFRSGRLARVADQLGFAISIAVPVLAKASLATAPGSSSLLVSRDELALSFG